MLVHKGLVLGHIRHGIGIFLGLAALSGCVTREEYHDDIFNLQTRMLSLEEGGSKTKSVGEAANQKLASTGVKMEEINAQLRSLQGELDAVKLALKTGRMPGQTDEDPSLGKMIDDLKARVDALEEAQVKMLEIMDKKTASKDKDKDKDKTLKSVSSFKTAFGKKHYTEIAEEWPNAKKVLKGEELNDVKFIFSESLFKLGRIREAALVYDELSKAKLDKDKTVKVQLRMGDCFRFLGDKKTALVYYHELVQKFPSSSEAEKAKEYIAKIEKG